MTTTTDFAEIVQTVEYDGLPEEVIDETKKRILDSIGIALGSIGERPVEVVRDTVLELDENAGPCSIWGADERASPPEATMMNTALIRYLDYMDSILLPGETPHPSDNIGAVIASGEYLGASGRDLVTATALAYEVQGELAAKAPGRDIGWDHIHVTFSATAAAAKVFDLDFEQTRDALGIAAASYNPLRTIRTGRISMWKGIASANMARNAVYTAMLVNNGMEGPKDAIEGQKGWKEIVQERDFEVDFSPECPRVLEVMTKKYMAGTHAQAAIEGFEELVSQHAIDLFDIDTVEIETYDSAHHVMGGGEGDRHTFENREQADHSIPYTMMVNALDGQLLKEQYTQDRIRDDDVLDLVQRVDISVDEDLTNRFNEHGEMAYDIAVHMQDGETYTTEKRDYDGHPNNRMTWDQHAEKFNEIAADVYGPERRSEIISTVRTLEEATVDDLVSLLGAPATS